MHISNRQPNEFTSRFAEANHIPHKVLDGNNADVKETKKVIDKIV